MDVLDLITLLTQPEKAEAGVTSKLLKTGKGLGPKKTTKGILEKVAKEVASTNDPNPEALAKALNKVSDLSVDDVADAQTLSDLLYGQELAKRTGAQPQKNIIDTILEAQERTNPSYPLENVRMIYGGGELNTPTVKELLMRELEGVKAINPKLKDLSVEQLGAFLQQKHPDSFRELTRRAQDQFYRFNPKPGESTVVGQHSPSSGILTYNPKYFEELDQFSPEAKFLAANQVVGHENVHALENVLDNVPTSKEVKTKAQLKEASEKNKLTPMQALDYYGDEHFGLVRGNMETGQGIALARGQEDRNILKDLISGKISTKLPETSANQEYISKIKSSKGMQRGPDINNSYYRDVPEKVIEQIPDNLSADDVTRLLEQIKKGTPAAAALAAVGITMAPTNEAEASMNPLSAARKAARNADLVKKGEQFYDTFSRPVQEGMREVGKEIPYNKDILEMQKRLQEARTQVQESANQIERATGKRVSLDELNAALQEARADVFEEWGEKYKDVDLPSALKKELGEDEITADLAKAGIGSAALGGLQKLMEYYDKASSYTDAPLSSAIKAIPEGKNPIEAFKGQAGKDPSTAPTGKEIAAAYGADDTEKKEFKYSPGNSMLAAGLLNLFGPANVSNKQRMETIKPYKEDLTNAELAGRAIDMARPDALDVTLGAAGVGVKGLKKAMDASAAARKISGLQKMGKQADLLLDVDGQTLNFGNNTAKAMEVKRQLEEAGRIPKGKVFSTEAPEAKLVDMSPEPKIDEKYLPSKKDEEETLQMFLDAQKNVEVSDPMKQFLEAKKKAGLD